MSKTGRNDPCPCGSGRKFKKCHGGGYQEVRHPSKLRTSEANHKQLRLLSEASTRYAKKCREIHQERLSLFSTREACTLEALERHEQWIRAQIAEIIRIHSPVFWLYLQRTDRLASTRVKECRKPYWSYVKTRLETMFWKYGDSAATDVRLTASGEIRAKVQAEDVCLYAGELSALACECVNLPIAYRRVAKGASLEIGGDGHFVANLPERLDAAGVKYDRRRNNAGRYQLEEKGIAVATPPYRGSWGAAFEHEEVGIIASKWPLLFYDENTEPEGTIEYSTGGFGGFEDPRFMRVSWNLNEWEERFERFSEALSTQTGMTLAEFKAGFLSLNDLLLAHLDGAGGISCHQLGLLAVPEVVLLEELSRFFLEHLPPPSMSRVETILRRFIAFLECDHAALESYDLFSPPVSCVLSRVGDDSILLDVSQIHHKLQDMMFSLRFDRKMGNSKGAIFEAIVGSEIRKHCESVSFPIPDSQDLFKANDIGPFAEMDLYIAKGNLLFLVECKARCVDNHYLKGEPKAVQDRWGKVKSWLARIDKQAQLIAQNPVGANYRIPPECRYIIPIVCSSMTEYIWEDEVWTQLTESIPRVCTIQELMEVIDDSQQLSLGRRPYAIEIAHIGAAARLESNR